MPPANPHTSLAMSIDQWRSEIGRYFGFGRTYSAMTASQQADVDAVIDRGLRQFYAPPVLQDGSAHIWSFMRPTTQITVHGAYTVGTLTDVDDAPQAFADFSGTTLPSWATNGTLSYIHPTSNLRCLIHVYAVATPTRLTLEDAVASDAFTGGSVEYELTDGIYALPTSFGGIEGDVTLDTASGYMPVRQVGEDQIREMFQNSSLQTGVPAYFCVRPWRNPNLDFDGNRGHIGMYTRYEMVFFPQPDKTYRMSFRYLFTFPGIADYLATGRATNELIPPGLAYHHETMLASCLAVAEQFADSPNGEHRDYFAKRIAASVALDRRVAGSAYLGQNIDRSDTLQSQGRGPLRTQITYNNVLY